MEVVLKRRLHPPSIVDYQALFVLVLFRMTVNCANLPHPATCRIAKNVQIFGFTPGLLACWVAVLPYSLGQRSHSIKTQRQPGGNLVSSTPRSLS